MHAEVEYATFAEFLTAAARRPYKEAQGATWAGTATFAEAHRLASEGWPEGLANTRVMRDAILRKVTKQVPKRRVQFALAGGAVSVGRFLSGRPDCFMVRNAVNDLRAAKGRRVLKVVVNVGARQGVPADVIFTRGAAAVALVNALEQSSYRCELWIASLAQKDFGTAGVRVRIKRADEPAQLDALAFCFASPALHRWLMFSIRTGVPALSRVLRKGVGGSIELPDGERGDIYFPCATNDSQWRSAEQTEAWVLERLREQGVAIETA